MISASCAAVMPGLSVASWFGKASRSGHAGTLPARASRTGSSAAEAAGPSQFAGHSLRVRDGASETAIMRQTGHRSLVVVRGYIRDGELFRDAASAKLGL
jgi:hypothetical protein